MIVSPSDHLITDEKAFQYQIEMGLAETSENNVLLTLGIKPHAPKTGFGYIQFSDESSATQPEVRKVKTFTEKPDLETAKVFLESGEFLWNAGIFIWNANAILNAYDKHLHDMYAAIDQGWEYLNTEKEAAFINSIYSTLENESIDYGILEKSKSVYVLPSEFGWSDLGTWGALSELLPGDENQNIIINKNVLVINASGNIVSIPKTKVTAIAGLQDFIVVDTPNSLLICPKDDEQTIKNFVAEVKVKFGEKFV
jgi:mannose-1-phosphate guanylyltransferase